MDFPGFTPTRRVEKTDSGYTVYVKPPLGDLPEVSVTLTPDQYLRYKRWRSSKELIQNLLPDLSRSEREKLMSGIGDDDFHRLFDE